MDIKTYLDRTGCTQVDLAERIGQAAGRILSPSLMSQWLNGHRPIAAVWAVPIERATGGQVPRHETCPDVFPRETAA